MSVSIDNIEGQIPLYKFKNIKLESSSKINIVILTILFAKSTEVFFRIKNIKTRS